MPNAASLPTKVRTNIGLVKEYKEIKHLKKSGVTTKIQVWIVNGIKMTVSMNMIWLHSQ